MPSSTVKRVVLYRFDRQPIEGFVNPHAYLRDHELEIMTLAGSVQASPYLDVKALCFASERSSNNLFTAHNLFERRPKVPGLWTRFTFRDNDQLDGILSHNLLEWPNPGFFLTPPRASATRQRVFVPREAVNRTEILGVVGASALRVLKRAKGKPTGDQLKMFDS
ncbi:MAG TPA: hypothetical protein VHZ07_10695 [Bryobacteraceae bacterium]|nr:hypothetical protein [Bryobacteraceae bacterium]